MARKSFFISLQTSAHSHLQLKSFYSLITILLNFNIALLELSERGYLRDDSAEEFS